jgi:hypothetical protein
MRKDLRTEYITMIAVKKLLLDHDGSLPLSTINNSLKLPKDNVSKRYLVKYVIMRWLWLGKVRVTSNNGNKIIKWIGRKKS